MAVIGVIGGSECSERGRALAREVGALIARGGDILICGGRTGVMEAACEGARSMGGVTVGVLPGTDRREANLFVTVPIATGLGVARNAIIARAADALIAVEGSYGTLSEMAYALGMGKTVVCLESWELARCGGTHERLLPAGTPEEAYALAKAALPPE